jgi:hypothetical protein
MSHLSLFPRSRTILVLVAFGFMVFDGAQRAGARDDKGPAQKARAKTQLDGAWRLVKARDPRTGQMRAKPPGLEVTKLLVGGQYAWTTVRDGKAVSAAGGTYKVDDTTYTETVVYSVDDNMLRLVGSSFPFKWSIENGKWHHRGTLRVGAARQEIDEIWEPAP